VLELIMKAEYKVNMTDARKRRSFTLVNARSAREAERIAERNHPSKIIVSSELTGRKF
jgi:PHD/YefM family antitoxin component YafN of YafNO toxin-antitoxin module